ncbi:hypothetical protein KR52_11575 [Synechococcus sp. KORDI-52]|uniref:hypothetical protein n=1 Tax=Synechococcus sp. KORDI-52 TaxID=585425 RepID=UPI0004E0940F|nr:hypothetical protein [Synechococcus sp. KORDI-52]AII49775.1 hypothetical protein KR52_11575 [Synechococcus sp. KORDI-52]
MAPTSRSSGIFPNTTSSDDDAGLLTTSFQSIVGLESAKTAQINIVATLAADTDEVIIQVQKGGVTKNLSFGWEDFKGPTQSAFVAGTYRLAGHTRGFGIRAARLGLSSTATDIHADISAVA